MTPCENETYFWTFTFTNKIRFCFRLVKNRQINNLHFSLSWNSLDFTLFTQPFSPVLSRAFVNSRHFRVNKKREGIFTLCCLIFHITWGTLYPDGNRQNDTKWKIKYRLTHDDNNGVSENYNSTAVLTGITTVLLKVWQHIIVKIFPSELNPFCLQHSVVFGPQIQTRHGPHFQDKETNNGG